MGCEERYLLTSCIAGTVAYSALCQRAVAPDSQVYASVPDRSANGEGESAALSAGSPPLWPCDSACSPPQPTGEECSGRRVFSLSLSLSLTHTHTHKHTHTQARTETSPLCSQHTQGGCVDGTCPLLRSAKAVIKNPDPELLTHGSASALKQ